MRNAAKAHDSVDISRLEILSLLVTKGLTGYELKKNIKASFNREISFGTLYPDLVSMEHAGLIRGEWTSIGKNQLRKKRIFTLTETGKSFLSENLAKLNNITVAMESMVPSPVGAL
jgi:DNA-binding PadR family transcriptional regulator